MPEKEHVELLVAVTYVISIKTDCLDKDIVSKVIDNIKPQLDANGVIVEDIFTEHSNDVVRILLSSNNSGSLSKILTIARKSLKALQLAAVDIQECEVFRYLTPYNFTDPTVNGKCHDFDYLMKFQNGHLVPCKNVALFGFEDIEELPDAVTIV